MPIDPESRTRSRGPPPASTRSHQQLRLRLPLGHRPQRHRSVLADSRGPETLEALVNELGLKVKAGPLKEAAQADIVFLAVNLNRLEGALNDLGLWNPHFRQIGFRRLRH